MYANFNCKHPAFQCRPSDELHSQEAMSTDTCTQTHQTGHGVSKTMYKHTKLAMESARQCTNTPDWPWSQQDNVQTHQTSHGVRKTMYKHTKLAMESARQCTNTRLAMESGRQCTNSRLAMESARQCTNTRLAMESARQCMPYNTTLYTYPTMLAVCHTAPYTHHTTPQV